jgi:hypothetical protein
MSQIRITSPTAAAAFVLTDLLGERGVTASPQADGTWEVVMTLDGSGPETLSIVLSTARDWLRTCALPGTQVSVGAHTHSLAAEKPAAAAVT